MIARRIMRDPFATRDHRPLVGMGDDAAAGIAGKTGSVQALGVRFLRKFSHVSGAMVSAMRTRDVIVALIGSLECPGDPAAPDDLRRRNARDLRLIEARGAADRQLLWVALRRHLELGNVIHQHQAARGSGQVVRRSGGRDLQRAVAARGLPWLCSVSVWSPRPSPNTARRLGDDRRIGIHFDRTHSVAAELVGCTTRLSSGPYSCQAPSVGIRTDTVLPHCADPMTVTSRDGCSGLRTSWISRRKGKRVMSKAPGMGCARRKRYSRRTSA